MKENSYYTSIRLDIQPFIPENTKRTLDVGCAMGAFSEMLKKSKGVNETWGVEMVSDCVRIAATRMDHVLKGAFEDVYDQLPNGYFDCVFLNDVLEHMVNPEECLMKLKSKLAPDGIVFASIPNVRHIEVLRELLLKGDWKYKDSGILDKTHLRFYTKKSMKRMFEECGYELEFMHGINGVGKWSLTNIISFLSMNKLEDIKYKQYLIKASSKL